MMWGDGWSWGWGMGWPMLFGWVIPLAVFVVFAYVLSRALSRGGQAVPPSGSGAGVPPRRETPLETAQRRYAAGEISREDFVRIRDDIGEGSGAAASPST